MSPTMPIEMRRLIVKVNLRIIVDTYEATYILLTLIFFTNGLCMTAKSFIVTFYRCCCRTYHKNIMYISK